MTINRRPTGISSSVPAGMIIGVMTALAVMVTGVCITAKMVDEELLAMDSVGYAVLVIIVLSSWISSTVAAARIKRMRMLVCAASAGLYFVTLFCITGLMFGGRYSGVGETFLLILCGAMLGYFSKKSLKNKRIKGIN